MDCKNLKSCQGLLLEVSSQIVMACSMVAFKSLRQASVEYFCFYVCVLQVTSLIPYVICRTKKTDYTVDLWSEKYAHLFRGISGAGTFFFYSMSLQYIPATDSSAVAKMTPIFVTILAYFFLNERPGWIRLVFLGVSVVGVLLVCRPNFIFGEDGVQDTWSQAVGLSCALIAAVNLSVTYISQKKMSRTPLPLSVLSNATVTMFICLLLLLFRPPWSRLNCADSLLLFFSNVGIFINVLFRFASSRLEDAGKLAVVSVVDLPIFMILDYLVFRIVPNWMGYLGVVLIVGCIVGQFLLTNRETVVPEPAEKVKRRVSSLPDEIENSKSLTETRV